MEEKSKVRWGIIGAGNIAQSFVKDFPFLSNGELIAIAARDIDRAKEFAQINKIPFAFTYDEMYNSTEIDAVYISTTHNFHFEQSYQCLLHGKAVLCEKPITLNDLQFKQLAALSKDKKVFLMEGMWTYFLPIIKKVQQWVDDGKIGMLKVIQVDFSFPKEKDMGGRMYNPDLAGGALLDLGIYPVALATLFMKRKPDSITASAVFTETGVDANTAMILHYGSATAILFSSMEVQTANKVHLYGENGYIQILDFWRANTAILHDKEHHVIETYEDSRTAHGFIYEMQHATDKILNNEIESNIMSLQRSNEIQEILTEVRRKIGLQYPMEKL